MRRRDVDLLHGRLTVAQALGELSSGKLVAKAPKTAAGLRTITVPGPLVAELERHLDGYVHADPDALVFTAPRGGPLRCSNFGADFRASAAAAGLEAVRFHDL